VEQAMAGMTLAAEGAEAHGDGGRERGGVEVAAGSN
jgi:hypothetical protein